MTKKQHLELLLNELEVLYGKLGLSMYHSGGLSIDLDWIKHRISVIKKEIKNT